MKKYLLILIAAFTFSACIKEAPLNPEADIESFDVDPGLLTGKTFIDQANHKIQLFLTQEAFEKGVTPNLVISKNATVKPASGQPLNFNNGPVQYTVTAEQGTNQKTYTVEVVNVGNWNFGFENWLENADDKYEYPIESNQTAIWTSGNPGVALSGVPKDRLSYPTRSTTDGYLGTKAAEMVTIKGTALSAFVGIYLYAGSLFIGNFNASVVFAQPLAATEFGVPYVGLPGRFTGYYKYSPGSAFQDENQNIIAGKTDECSIYAVLFEGPDRLNGTNVNTSDKVIAVARLADGSAKAAFTRFDIPFVYKTGWNTSAKNLMMAIVASSSKEGDHYRGALGSRLVVDNLSVIPK